MCQYVETEQFLGAVAYQTIGNATDDEKAISLTELNRISSFVEKEIRKSVDAVLSFSGAGVFSTISNYASCYVMKNYEISFTRSKEIYDSYFLAGMNIPVRKALENAITKSIK